MISTRTNEEEEEEEEEEGERTIQTTTTRDYARALAESEGNQDVSVLLEDPSSSTSPRIFFSKLCGVAKLFDRFVRLRFGPAELSQELLVRSWGVGEYARDTAQRRVFSDRVEHNHGKFVAE